MDMEDIKRFALAARQFSVEVEPGVHVTLRAPTRHELQMASARSEATGGSVVSLVAWRRDLSVRAVVVWSGVRVGHVLPDHADANPDEPLPFDQELVAELLDAQPEWEALLADALFKRLGERSQRKDEAAKN